MCRPVSSWVGDHQRIPAVDCFCLLISLHSVSNAPKAFKYCIGPDVQVVLSQSAFNSYMLSTPANILTFDQIFAVLIVVLSLGISNATFSFLRKSHDFNSHAPELPRNPSAHYPPSQPHGIHAFGAAEGVGYGGHQLGWQDNAWGGGDTRQDLEPLEYRGSPSKRSHSPVKRMPSR